MGRYRDFIKCRLKIPSSVVQKPSHRGKRDVLQRKEYPLVHSGRVSLGYGDLGALRVNKGTDFVCQVISHSGGSP